MARAAGIRLDERGCRKRRRRLFGLRSHGRIAGARDYLAKSPTLTGVWYRTNCHGEKAEKGDVIWIEDEETTQYVPNPHAEPLDARIVKFLERLPLISKGLLSYYLGSL